MQLSTTSELSPPAALQVLSLWIPLVSVDANSGCLSLVKGSHKLGKIQEAGSHQGGGSGWPNGLAQYGTVCAEAMEPGDGAHPPMRAMRTCSYLAAAVPHRALLDCA